jgi:hypothetical protein
VGDGEEKFVTKQECEKNRSSCAFILKEISEETGDACGVAKDIHEDLKEMTEENRTSFKEVKEILMDVATIQKINAELRREETELRKEAAKREATAQQMMWKLIMLLASAGITVVFALAGLRVMGFQFP